MTLLEIMIAMLVASLVLLAAHRVLGLVGDEVTRARIPVQDASGAYLLMRELALQIEAGPGSVPLSGDSGAVRFGSHCTAAGGWSSPCSVEIAIAHDGDQCVATIAAGSDATRIVSQRPCGLRYLIDAESGGHWSLEWCDASRLPQAIELVAGSDSLLVRTGTRG